MSIPRFLGMVKVHVMRIFLDTRLECIVWMSLVYPSVQIDTEHTYVLPA